MNELRQQALRLLPRREYTHAELRNKLAGGQTGDKTAEDIDTVLAGLAACGLLSDARAAASYLHAHGGRFGVARLRQALRTKGLDDETISASIEAAGLADETERACAVWRSKFRMAPKDPRDWARQARFLQSRGFSTDVIRHLLKDRKKQDHE